MFTYIVTADRREAGVVVLERSAFRFHASERAFAALETREFTTCGDVIAAARELLACSVSRARLPTIDIVSVG